ncbi:MAG TPA: ABC transporter permease subunit [Gaiellaceae bacterium]|nr:ABC transporter permease subunit [Gaiellaceae bacterium]
MALAAFLLRRLVLAALVLLAVSFPTFVFFAGNFNAICGPKEHTLSATLPYYWRWLQGIPSGRSLKTSICGWPPLWQNLEPSLGRTAALLGLTLVLVLVLALVVAAVSAAAPGSWLDLGLRGFSYLAWATPAFFVAGALQWLATWAGEAHGIHWLPLRGWPGFCPDPRALNPFANDVSGQPLPTLDSTCPAAPGGLHYYLACLRYLVLPSLALALSFVGLHSRHLRSALLLALRAPFATTARAKGLTERRILLRHALRASLATFTSAVLLDFGSLFGAALAVDWIFKLNGVGMLFANEISAPFVDAYAIQLLLLVTAAIVVGTSLLAELALLWLDPRARPA